MDATVSTPLLRGDLSEGMTRANNNFVLEYSFNQYLLNRKPDYLVYLFTLTDQTFEVSRPPLIKKMIIPSKSSLLAKQPEQKDTRYALVTTFPHPLVSPDLNIDSGEVTYRPNDTRRVVMDILNSENLGIDQDFVPEKSLSQGVNLGVKGLFWSVNPIPTEQEISSAIKRLENEYKRLLEIARTTEVSNPAALRDVLTSEHHFAAEYFGEEHSWHNKKRRANTGTCPNCGDSIREGAAFHKTDEGVLCIIDWARAVKSGVRTKAQAIDAGIPGFTSTPVTVAVVDDGEVTKSL